MKLNPIASNMTEVQTEKGAILFSYKTPVAAYIDGKFYKTDKKWSVTTSRHINKWFGTKDVCEAAEEKPQDFFDSLV